MEGSRRLGHEPRGRETAAPIVSPERRSDRQTWIVERLAAWDLDLALEAQKSDDGCLCFLPSHSFRGKFDRLQLGGSKIEDRSKTVEARRHCLCTLRLREGADRPRERTRPVHATSPRASKARSEAIPEEWLRL